MRRAHYLKPLLTDTIPDRHIVFDTETRARTRAGQRSHYWACGASITIQRETPGSFYHRSGHWHDAPEDLWVQVAAEHEGVRRLVVWAHNLGFDMRVSEALRYLPQNGYSLEAIVLSPIAAWASFASDMGTLMLCDLYSWLPVPLDKIAATMGTPRGQFNYSLADPGELEQRCMEDATTASVALKYSLEFLESINSGPFRPTGSGQSHSHWRRRYLKPRQVLVHGDAYALERERRAMWTGRAEAWRHGKVKGPLYEYDLNLAYCRIAAECKVPVRLKYRNGPGLLLANLRGYSDTTVLAEVEVTTTEPLVPTGDGERIYWPVGTFRTVLWQPELELLHAEGAKVTSLRHWVYDCEPVLQPMAQWIIDELSDEAKYKNSPVKYLLKHWARTLVGRCGLRYRQWDDFGEVADLGLSLWTDWDDSTGEKTEMLQVGERIMELADMAEADTSVPQITGWVMSECRRRLWTIVACCSPENVIYMDTDSVIVNALGSQHLFDSAHPYDNPYLVKKATWAGASIAGPRNLTLEHQRRVAGVPRHAVRVGEHTYDGEVFTGLKSGLSGRQHDNVRVAARTFKVTQSDTRRVYLPNGTTRPHEVNNEPAD